MRVREGTEERISGGETDACADGCDVVQMVPGSFDFEQNRAHTCEFAARTQTQASVRRHARRRRSSRLRTRRRRAAHRRDRPRVSVPLPLARARGACRRSAHRGAGSDLRPRGSENAPDSMTPAWIGPTATWYASSPRTATVQFASSRSCSTSGRSGSCPSKVNPYRSTASRSSQPAAAVRSTMVGTRPSWTTTDSRSSAPLGATSATCTTPPAEAYRPAKREALGESRGDWLGQSLQADPA